MVLTLTRTSSLFRRRHNKEHMQIKTTNKRNRVWPLVAKRTVKEAEQQEQEQQFNNKNRLLYPTRNKSKTNPILMTMITMVVVLTTRRKRK